MEFCWFKKKYERESLLYSNNQRVDYVQYAMSQYMKHGTILANDEFEIWSKSEDTEYVMLQQAFFVVRGVIIPSFKLKF